MKNSDDALQVALSLAEVNQILEALGSRPYVKVYQLIGKIQQQAESQLSPTAGEAGLKAIK